jgi:O-antigen/teichoic acid export membrane protein
MTNLLSRNSLLLSMLSNWVALLVSVLVGFFLTSYIIGHLGKTGFGVWTLINSIIGYYNVLELGVTSALTRYVARDAGKKDYQTLNLTTNTALVFFFSVGFAIFSASFWIATPLIDFFHVEQASQEDFKLLTLILGMSVSLLLPGGFFSAIINAHEQFLITNAVNISVVLFRTILIIIFLNMELGLKGLAYANFAGALLNITLYYVLCLKLFPYLKFSFLGARFETFKVLIKFGAPTIIMAIASVLRFELDSFVIGKWLDLSAVGVFAVAGLLMRYYVLFLNSATITTFMPRFATLEGEGKYEALNKLYLKSLSIGAFLSFGIATPIILYGEQFIMLWAGRDFLEAVPVLWLLAASFALTMAQSSSVAMMYALNKHQVFAVVSLIEGIANLLLSIYLAPKYGIVGVALGTAIPMIFVKLILQPLYLTRIVDVPLYAYVSTLLPPLILAIILGGIPFYAPQWIPHIQGYLALIIWSFPILLCFGLFYSIIHPEDGHKILAKITRKPLKEQT